MEIVQYFTRILLSRIKTQRHSEPYYQPLMTVLDDSAPTLPFKLKKNKIIGIIIVSEKKNTRFSVSFYI